jgi:hypothetical protein
MKKKSDFYNQPYCVINLAYDLILENHQEEYYVRVEFFHKLDVISIEGEKGLFS